MAGSMIHHCRLVPLENVILNASDPNAPYGAFNAATVQQQLNEIKDITKSYIAVLIDISFELILA